MVILKVCGRIFGDLRGYFSQFRDFGIYGIFWLLRDFMNIMIISKGFCYFVDLGGICVIFEVFR